MSHDRYFIDQLINKVWYVEDKNIITHLGNYSEFIEKYKKTDSENNVNNLEAKNNNEGQPKTKKEKAEEAISKLGSKRKRLYKQARTAYQETGNENALASAIDCSLPSGGRTGSHPHGKRERPVWQKAVF